MPSTQILDKKSMPSTIVFIIPKIIGQSWNLNFQLQFFTYSYVVVVFYRLFSVCSFLIHSPHSKYTSLRSSWHSMSKNLSCNFLNLCRIMLDWWWSIILLFKNFCNFDIESFRKFGLQFWFLNEKFFYFLWNWKLANFFLNFRSTF